MSQLFNDNPSSWEENIKQYEAAKRAPLKEWAPAERINKCERQKKEREIDPILLQYRDPVKEEMYNTLKSETLRRTTEKNEKILSNKFNIITNEGTSKKDSLQRKIRKDPYSRNWNMLSHLPVSEQASAPTLYNEEFNQSFAFKPKSLIDAASSNHVNKREVDIISNKYYQNDSLRVLEEQSALKDKLIQKFWKSHSYDPIRIKYYDPEKEADFQDQRQFLEQIHGTSQLARIPVSIQNAEGKSYNIVNHITVDENKLRATVAIEDRLLNRSIGHAVESQTKEAADKKEQEDQSRRLNRIRYERWEYQVGRGYNPVNNLQEVNHPLIKKPEPLISQFSKSMTGSASTGNLPNNSRDLSGRPVVTAPANITASIGGAEIEQGGLRKGQGQGGGDFYGTIQQQHNPKVTASKMLDGRLPVVASHQSVLRSSVTPVPSLDLSRTEPPTTVSYKEPSGGPPGMPVPIVRTGGWASKK